MCKRGRKGAFHWSLYYLSRWLGTVRSLLIFLITMKSWGKTKHKKYNFCVFYFWPMTLVRGRNMEFSNFTIMDTFISSVLLPPSIPPKHSGVPQGGNFWGESFCSLQRMCFLYNLFGLVTSETVERREKFLFPNTLLLCSLRIFSCRFFRCPI